jgi:hypothetical protein
MTWVKAGYDWRVTGEMAALVCAARIPPAIAPVAAMHNSSQICRSLPESSA